MLYGPNGLHAFEIKMSSTITNKSLKGLKTFEKEYPQASLNIIYLGQNKEYHGNINAIPFKEALEKIPNILKNTN